MTTDDMFNRYKNEIKMALTKSKIYTGYEDENGHPVYETVTKDEIIEHILEIYDATIWEFIQVNTSGVVIEKLLHEYVPDLDEREFFQKYIQMVEKERIKSTYEFEKSDIECEMERDIIRNSLYVIDGGKK